MTASQSKVGLWEPMVLNIKGHSSVWIKLVPKHSYFENLALAPGFAGERHILLYCLM